MAQIPGDGSRWFVALRGTRNDETTSIVSFPTDGSTPAHEAATVGPVDYVMGGEGGLLGMAFHPRFSETARVYLSYVAPGGVTERARSVIAYMTTTDGGVSFGGVTEVLSFDQPYGNHKGGGLAFGPDGYLYATFGDGRYPADLDARGQNTNGMFAKVIRIDVDAESDDQSYGIPADNPFASGGGEPATYAWGFRNPFRFSFDRKTGDLWLGDVGEHTREEIDLVQRGGNYGWPCREGTLDFAALDPIRCPDPNAPMTAPIFEHSHNGDGRSITGGVVYRGSAIPSLDGHYIYGDFISQELFALDRDPLTGEPRASVLNPHGPGANWSNFAEDQDGEVYALGLMQGAIYKMVPAEPVAEDDFPGLLSQTGCVLPTNPTLPAPGVLAYDLNAPLWSDGAEKQRWFAIPDGTTIHIAPDGDFDLPPGSVTMKSFSLNGRLVETRLFMRDDTGAWTGYSYEWNDEQTEASLLPGAKTKVVEGASWAFPSRTECNRCHTEAAGSTLGLELGQLNRNFRYVETDRSANQLQTLAHVGLVDRPADALHNAIRFADPLSDEPIVDRARAYLHANCSSCHRPEGGGRSALDLRYSAPFTMCNAPPEGSDVGVAGAKILVPGDPLRSLITIRAGRRDYFRMPPLGSSVVDYAGSGVLHAWISQMQSCPN
ncbi:MAG: PQQ-dependent sugar dehydrogenase [Labilithrix sp.]|nr:PQQ-dependent sugar dehydrogenase [Labilithrix sp.]MBX3210771.1 PQQ-dependent sugar dehydrogenase [Labilithrix sp.]